MNLRFFFVEAEEPFWYFGGGYDLTPCYPRKEDAIDWHKTARDAVGEHYQAFKETCDDYFYLPHRNETRGVGGIFFDDWSKGGFEASFDLAKAVGDSFLPAYVPIFQRRKEQAFTEAQRDFQLIAGDAMRNLIWPLIAVPNMAYKVAAGSNPSWLPLPPLVKWIYNYKAEPGSPEAELTDYYLKPQNWLTE